MKPTKLWRRCGSPEVRGPGTGLGFAKAPTSLPHQAQESLAQDRRRAKTKATCPSNLGSPVPQMFLMNYDMQVLGLPATPKPGISRKQDVNRHEPRRSGRHHTGGTGRGPVPELEDSDPPEKRKPRVRCLLPTPHQSAPLELWPLRSFSPFRDPSRELIKTLP